MKRLPSWVVSDAFWSRIEPLIPLPQRDPEKEYKRKAGGGRKPKAARTVFGSVPLLVSQIAGTFREDGSQHHGFSNDRRSYHRVPQGAR